MNSFEIASRSLRANILTLPSGKFVTAGQNQFLTLWTRDFCHAVRGLLVLNEDETVRNHLTFLLNSLRADGLVPRVVDNRLVQLRVAWQAARKLLPFLPKLTFKEPLKPQYTDEHGSCAIDSNLLVLMAALRLKDRPRGEEWWSEHKTQLERVFHYYDDKFKDGLIFQTPFADWQDSASREGFTFLTNFFYYSVSVRMGKTFDKQILKNKFFDKKNGVFKTMVGSDILSVDGNLFVLEHPDFLTISEKKALWENLKATPLLNDGIGMCSYPDYARKDLAFHVKFARLDAYHGHLAWSWLMGLGLHVCRLMEDREMERMQRELIDRVLGRDDEVLEIYIPQDQWRGWESWLVRSERPFAWGAGYLVESLS